jgi:hypothetical protein
MLSPMALPRKKPATYVDVLDGKELALARLWAR